MPARWRRITWFYALCWILLLLVPALHALFVNGSMDFDAAARRATAETGLDWTSSLWQVVRLARAEPVLWLLVLGSAVPSLAAFVVAGSLGRSELVGRLRPIGKGFSVSRALLHYAAIVPLLATCLLATYGIRQLLAGSGAWVHPPGVLGWSLLPALLTAACLDQGGVLEELGWRGYAQPELQRSLTSPLAAAVLIGVAWGLWHVPRDVVAGAVDRLGLVEYLVLFLPAFVAGTVAVSVIAAFFANRCGGSVLPAIMVHGVSNDAIGLSGHAAMETILTPVHQATQALPLAALAAILIALFGPELGRRRGAGA